MQTAVCILHLCVCVCAHISLACACVNVSVLFPTLSALWFDRELEVKGQGNITGCLFGAFPPVALSL